MKTMMTLAVVLLFGCGGPCAPFAGDPVSYGRCEFAETQCEERCVYGVQTFYCLPPSGDQTSMTCTCACRQPPPPTKPAA